MSGPWIHNYCLFYKTLLRVHRLSPLRTIKSFLLQRVYLGGDDDLSQFEISVSALIRSPLQWPTANFLSWKSHLTWKAHNYVANLWKPRISPMRCVFLSYQKALVLVSCLQTVPILNHAHIICPANSPRNRLLLWTPNTA